MYSVQIAILVICIILPILAIASVCLRFMARKARQLPLLADDWVVFVALMATVPSSILTFYGVLKAGLGLGPGDVSHSRRVQGFKLYYFIMLLVFFNLGAVKISVVLFFKRLFPNPRFKLASNIMICAVAAWSIAQFIIQSLNSWKIQGFWRFELLDYKIFNICMAALDLLFDVLILLMPLPLIKSLRIDTKQKYSLIGLFWLGSFCVISSALRIYYTVAFAQVNRNSSDSWITYILSSNSLWLIVETNLSIIAACLPTLGAFLKSRALRTSSSAHYTYQNCHTNCVCEARKGSRKGSRTGPSLVSRELGNPWMALRNMSSNTTVTNSSHRCDDADNDIISGIMVERTFGSEIEPV